MTDLDLPNKSVEEKKVYSQNGEDGVLEHAFTDSETGRMKRHGTYLEFGVEDGMECNTRRLREIFDWHGTMWDGTYSNPEIGLHREFVTAENVMMLCDKHRIPNEIDLLSIDIDRNDWYVWRALCRERLRPKAVMIEFNAALGPHSDKVVPYCPTSCWDGSDWFGASIKAMTLLGQSLGYTLVYCEQKGVNLLFVRDDQPEILGRFDCVSDVEKIYRPPRYGVNPLTGGHRADPHLRPFLSAQDMLLTIK